MNELTRVVIVEDNDFDRDLMSDVLACNDMKPETALDDSFIDEISCGGRHCDIVVVDLDLPDQRGFETVRRLASLPAGKRPRIVGLAHAAGPVRSADGAEYVLEDLLSRPLDVGGFARSVKRQALEARLA